MKNDIFVMLDLETLGNRINPVIVQISAAAFTLENGANGDDFNALISKDSCELVGLETDKPTLQWWSEQSEDAKSIVFGSDKERMDLKVALYCFNAYLEGLKRYSDNIYLWGNGIRADNVWLLSAYKALGMSDPIAYNRDLDYRTLHYLAKKKTGIDFKKETEFKGVQHNAIDDCKYQIDCAVKMWNALEK